MKTVYLVYNYFDGNDGVHNPILYNDFKLANDDCLKRSESGFSTRVIYLDPPIGKYKNFSDYAQEIIKENEK